MRHLPTLIISFFPLWVAAHVHADESLARDFTVWASENDMEPAALVVLGADGREIARVGAGIEPHLPLPIASISKTIAGQCALFMADSQIISLDDPVSRYLPWSGDAGAITVSQLLTHSSGFGPDETQGYNGGTVLADPERVDQIIRNVSTRTLEFPSGSHHYNNENYLVLERVMAEAVGTGVLDWCRQSVPSIATLATLSVNVDVRAMGMAGGLEVSMIELADFFQSLDAASVEDWPSVWFGSNNSYGPGVVIQNVRGGVNLFHSGLICTNDGPSFGSLAARFPNGVSVALAYSGCPDAEGHSFLNRLALSFANVEEGGH